ncbi:cysteine desulfurase / selenocysteine lyase [Candidatus Kryptonium thompsonii]|uniref:Cysteine desulfurase / selenocysteine lyase n=1 Tax=Candidatus Kryptonium thompsonii TaxID=1633631 RepID=A0A0P1L6B1_9BACT|nr:aminotransferase class V-fold PLP-dependent enzyme [Candidatus Kryptonium thompsoni]CUS76600.1 cysteine desulfurase / selenocysteine lyase [Candidatus Kryptonium thompsoni]CUS76777.1 cysteine desulfurase / selenocysteine lyase [Candidatus Kryptonium thompsoni]CUS83092.1 cysteine desulfurase / selenocysteine lyase [Candidatus Kryptonium thompsoni]CUS95265.1 cysteine desulfurase / selenocysteine lyase [Candidatus Kryptonium thompsoni]CUT01563.1 cysteine desulfurase / selenocysteine lyase [Can
MRRKEFLKSMAFLTFGALFPNSKKLDYISIENFKEKISSFNSSDPKFWKLIRDQFPIPKDFTYLNTGGLGSSPFVVAHKVKEETDILDKYPTPNHDLEKWWKVKEKCADIFGCDKEEIALVSCATEGINIVVNGLPLKKGDEVILTTHEHAAGNIPLLNRAKRDGIVLKTFEPDAKNWVGNLERLEKLITKRTRLIFVSHITCTTGQRLPEREICKLAKDKGLWVFLDGAQVPGMMPVDVREYGCDFYTTSGHKWLLGPKRTGILYVKKENLELVQPLTVGGYSDAGYSVEKNELKFQPSAQRFEYGTQNPALFFGLETAIDFLNAIGIDKVWEHDRALAEAFYQELIKIANVEVLSPEEENFRTAMITFRMKNITYDKIVSYLMEKRIRVRPVTEGNLMAVRVSFHVYNNEMDVAKILSEIKNLAQS